MSLEKELSGISRFTGEDFHIWKWQMKGLLKFKKLLAVVEGTEKCSATDGQDKIAWEEKDYTAYTLLQNAVDRKLLAEFLDCNTAHEMWTTLLTIYEHKSSSDVHELQRRFFNAKIQPGQSFSDYFGKLNLIISELKEIGDTTFTEDSMISKLTSNLPPGYDSFYSAWDSTPKSEATLANLKL